MIRKIRKICSVLQRKWIQTLMYFNNETYMRAYVKYLRKHGMDIPGMPNYISNDVHFDGKDYSIIHIGTGCTISREVLFLTHDYSRHTVFAGLKDQITPENRIRLTERDETDKLLDLRGIYVGDHSFIGARALLLPGTHIGNNCIVGGGSVVKGTFPDYTILFGNPAAAYHMTTDQWLEVHAECFMEEIK